MGADIVVYSPATMADFTSYYNRLERLLSDESEMNKLLKPLKVSRKSLVIRSASKILCVSKKKYYFYLFRSFKEHHNSLRQLH